MAFANTNTDDDGAGRLGLNVDVLVNESVGTGAAGDHAIRGRLFSNELTAVSRALKQAESERLSRVNALTFESSTTVAGEFETVRAELFHDYNAQVVVSNQARSEASQVSYLLVVVLFIPAVLVGGVFLGRFWARRKRVVT